MTLASLGRTPVTRRRRRPPCPLGSTGWSSSWPPWLRPARKGRKPREAPTVVSGARPPMAAGRRPARRSTPRRPTPTLGSCCSTATTRAPRRRSRTTSIISPIPPTRGRLATGWKWKTKYIQEDYAGAAAAYLGAIHGWPQTQMVARLAVVKLSAFVTASGSSSTSRGRPVGLCPSSLGATPPRAPPPRIAPVSPARKSAANEPVVRAR